MKDSRLVVIAAHQDDEVISSGVLISKVVQEKGKVCVITVFGRSYAYGDVSENASFFDENEDFLKVKELLGYRSSYSFNHKEGEPGEVGFYSILKEIEPILQECKPTILVVPSLQDLNQDHKHLHKVALIAARSYGGVSPTLILESVAFDGLVKEVNFFLKHTEEEFNRKAKGIGLYRKEVRGGNHPRAIKSIEGQHKVWGSMVNAEYAEAYRICKMVV